MTVVVTSIVTQGAQWPDGCKNETGSAGVLMILGEDDADRVVMPRLEACRENLA